MQRLSMSAYTAACIINLSNRIHNRTAAEHAAAHTVHYYTLPQRTPQPAEPPIKHAFVCFFEIFDCTNGAKYVIILKNIMTE